MIYNHLVKHNGIYYKPGENVPDDVVKEVAKEVVKETATVAKKETVATEKKTKKTSK